MKRGDNLASPVIWSPKFYKIHKKNRGGLSGPPRLTHGVSNSQKENNTSRKGVIGGQRPKSPSFDL
jgi:hypothetical protein